jgi:hypothetical protein
MRTLTGSRPLLSSIGADGEVRGFREPGESHSQMKDCDDIIETLIPKKDVVGANEGLIVMNARERADITRTHEGMSDQPQDTESPRDR